MDKAPADPPGSSDHPVREEIWDLLGQCPGLNKNRIASRLDIFPNQVRYHLDRMAQQDLVVERPGDRDGEVLVFRRRDAHLWEDERLRILYGRPATREVALYLADHPGTYTREIAAALDRNPATIRSHLQRLQQRELLADLKVGRRVEYHGSRDLREWARTTGATFPRTWQEPPK